MQKITVGVDGMMCNMCESHVNEAVRKALGVDKVTSSHTKGETVIITDKDGVARQNVQFIEALQFGFTYTFNSKKD